MADRYITIGKGAALVLAPDALKRLVKDCIARNHTAQKQFYDAYVPLIYGIIKRYLYNKTAAEEVLNDCFLRIFGKMDQYGFNGPIEAWMRRITVNLITDHLRKNIKYEQEIHVEEDTINAYTNGDQVDKLSYKELLAFVHQLPDMQRAVFNLYIFEDLPHKEIAQLMNISENNSRWHLNDARRRLKEKINNSM